MLRKEILKAEITPRHKIYYLLVRALDSVEKL
jgi:hypothetical protein